MKARIRHFFLLHDHWHWIDVVDIAYSKVQGEPCYLTASKYRCLLCGRELIDYDEPAIELLRKGNPLDAAVVWMR